MSYLRAVLLVAGKDLRVELRSREQAVTLLFFALLVLVVFNFAFDFTVIDFATLGPGVLWVAFMFSGVLAIGRSFQIEREQGRIEGIRLAPIDRSAFYLGKVAATVLFMTAVQSVLVPVAVVMFNFRFSGRIALAILALVLNTIGFAAVGTLFAAMLLRSRSRDVLLPIVLYPITVPVIIAGVRGTAALLQPEPDLAAAGAWAAMLVSFDVVFITLALWTFEAVMSDGA